MSHYVDIHLENKSIGTIILYIGVNELWNDNNQCNVDNLMSNIPKIIENVNKLESQIFLCPV